MFREPKWTNNAGPRKSKQAVKLVSALTWTLGEHVEITDSWRDGEPPNRTAFRAMCAEPPADMAAEYQSFGERYNWTLTDAALPAFEREAGELLTKLRAMRPVIDKTRAAESDEERTAREERQRVMRENEEKYARARDAEKESSAALMAKRPANAAAIILAIENHDTSDLMTDYHGSRPGRTVAIGWRTGSREDFRQLRAAASTFPETAHLGTGCDLWRAHFRHADACIAPCGGYNSGRHVTAPYFPETRHVADARYSTRAEAAAAVDALPGKYQMIDVRGCDDFDRESTHSFAWDIHNETIEHRDNYSMGHGNYLSRGSWDNDGWKIVSAEIRPNAEGIMTFSNRGHGAIEDALPTGPTGGPTAPRGGPTGRGPGGRTKCRAAGCDCAEDCAPGDECSSCGGTHEHDEKSKNAHVEIENVSVSMTLNEEKNGVELRFSEKPSEEMRERMLAAGFKVTRRPPWVWYARVNIGANVARGTADVLDFAVRTAGKADAEREEAALESRGIMHGAEDIAASIARVFADSWPEIRIVPHSGPLPRHCPQCEVERGIAIPAAGTCAHDMDPAPQIVEPISGPGGAYEAAKLNAIAKQHPGPASKLRAAAARLQREIDKPRPWDGANPTRKRIQAWGQHARDVMRAEELQAALLTLAGWHESGEWPTWESVTRSTVHQANDSNSTLARLVQPSLDSEQGQRPITTECDCKGFGFAVALLRRCDAKDVQTILTPWNLEQLTDGIPARAINRWLLLTAPSPANDPDKIRAREIAAAELKIAQSKIPGFFATPEPIAQQMAEAAEIQPGMRVLEPSAGIGRIADAVRAAEPGATVEAVEINHTLADLLRLKGYDVAQMDFVAQVEEWHNPANHYRGIDTGAAIPMFDRVLMNPPFEDSQDIEHVRAAYRMLKPGGRLVALMSQGGWFRNDRKAREFRAWLAGIMEQPGRDSSDSPRDDAQQWNMPARAFSGEAGILNGRRAWAGWEALPEGSFKESGTGVAVRMLVIDKPAAVAVAVAAEECKHLTERIGLPGGPLEGQSICGDCGALLQQEDEPQETEEDDAGDESPDESPDDEITRTGDALAHGAYERGDRITDNERAALAHWSMFGSDGYPVLKCGDSWTVDHAAAPNMPLYPTKRAAVRAWEILIAKWIRLDALAKQAAAVAALAAVDVSAADECNECGAPAGTKCVGYCPALEMSTMADAPPPEPERAPDFGGLEILFQ